MPRRYLAALFVAATLAAASLAPPTARADVRRTYEAGAWSLYTGTSTTGRSVCDMRVADDAGTKKIDVIYFINDNHLTVRMNKATWQIPANTRVGVVLQFDAYPVWTATADGAGGDVEFTVPTNALADFSRQFRYGSRMRITFPDGSEAPWLASLAGTNFMLDRFLECVQRIRGTDTQPYADAPSQPARPSEPTQPTQPYPGGETPEPAPSFGGERQPYRGTQRPPQAAPAPAPAQPAQPPRPAAPQAPATGGDDNRI